MKKRLLKPVVTNEKIIAATAILLALFIFGFWRIIIFKNTQPVSLSLSIPVQKHETLPENPSPSVKNATKKIPILMYHHIGPIPENADQLKKGLSISETDFELQVAWLHGQGYQSLTLNQLLEKLKKNEPLPEKPVIFTFDDGYDDTLIYAPKILKNYGFTGDFAIITQFVGISLGNNSYASWQDIKTAKLAGMEIISHTQDHFDGTNKKYTDIFISNNLKNSQKDIQDNLGKTFPILIYPYGHFDDRYIKLAQEAGFEMGITTIEGQTINTHELMTIPRMRVNGGISLEKFKKIFIE